MVRIPFERKCFPNDRTLPIKKQGRPRKTERVREMKKHTQSQVLGKRRNKVNGQCSPLGGLFSRSQCVCTEGDVDLFGARWSALLNMLL